MQSAYDLKQKHLSSEETQNMRTAAQTIKNKKSADHWHNSVMHSCFDLCLSVSLHNLWNLSDLEVALALQERRSDEALDLWCLSRLHEYQSQLHQNTIKSLKLNEADERRAHLTSLDMLNVSVQRTSSAS